MTWELREPLFPFYHGNLSWSFNHGVGSGSCGDRALALQAIRLVRAITGTSDPQVVGAKIPLHKHGRGAWGCCRGESFVPPPSEASSWVNLELGGGELAAKVIIQLQLICEAKSK